MDDDDEKWLEEIQKSKGVRISADDFEYLIDFLEKQEYLYPMLKLNMEKAVKEVKSGLVEPLRLVHEYWRRRVEERGGRPLLRRFLNHGAEKFPFAAFGVKMIPPPANQQKRRGVIEDERALARLRYIHAQFIQVRLLLAKVLQREELKREKIKLAQTTLDLLVHFKQSGGLSNTPGTGLLERSPVAHAGTGSFLPPHSISVSALAKALPAAHLVNTQLHASHPYANVANKSHSPAQKSAPVSTPHRTAPTSSLSAKPTSSTMATRISTGSAHLASNRAGGAKNLSLLNNNSVSSASPTSLHGNATSSSVSSGASATIAAQAGKKPHSISNNAVAASNALNHTSNASLVGSNTSMNLSSGTMAFAGSNSMVGSNSQTSLNMGANAQPNSGASSILQNNVGASPTAASTTPRGGRVILKGPSAAARAAKASAATPNSALNATNTVGTHNGMNGALQGHIPTTTPQTQQMPGSGPQQQQHPSAYHQYHQMGNNAAQQGGSGPHTPTQIPNQHYPHSQMSGQTYPHQNMHIQGHPAYAQNNSPLLAQGYVPVNAASSPRSGAPPMTPQYYHADPKVTASSTPTSSPRIVTSGSGTPRGRANSSGSAATTPRGGAILISGTNTHPQTHAVSGISIGPIHGQTMSSSTTNGMSGQQPQVLLTPPMHPNHSIPLHLPSQPYQQHQYQHFGSPGAISTSPNHGYHPQHAMEGQVPSNMAVNSIQSDLGAVVHHPVVEEHGTKLEGEYALNPENLLRGYPFIGGVKRSSQPSVHNQEGASSPNAGASALAARKNRRLSIPSTTHHSQPASPNHLPSNAHQTLSSSRYADAATLALPLPFSSKRISPFFDPATGERYDSYAINDDEAMAIEELEMDCEDDEEDTLIANLEELISSPLPMPFRDIVSDQQDRSITNAHIYKQPFGQDDAQYRPTDTLLHFDKARTSFLRKQWLESHESPYNAPFFAAFDPSATEGGAQSDPKNQQKFEVAAPQNKANDTSSNDAYIIRGTRRYQIPVVEPIMLPATLPGYHVFSSRPSSTESLPPRRYQVKTSITPNTVNGLPYATWLTGATMPVGPVDAFSEKSPYERVFNHDDFGTTATSPHRSHPSNDVETMRVPAPKRMKLANGEMSYDLVDANEFCDSISDNMFFTAEGASYNLVDLGREGSPRRIRGRKRIDRAGRVVWDVMPASYFEDVAQEEQRRIAAETSSFHLVEGENSAEKEKNAEVCDSGLVSSGMTSKSPDLIPSSDITNSIPFNMDETSLGNGVGSNSHVTISEAHLAADFEPHSISGATLTANTSPEPNSIDAESGETTLANGSCSHSPGASSTHSASHLSPTLASLSSSIGRSLGGDSSASPTNAISSSPLAASSLSNITHHHGIMIGAITNSSNTVDEPMEQSSASSGLHFVPSDSNPANLHPRDDTDIHIVSIINDTSVQVDGTTQGENRRREMADGYLTPPSQREMPSNHNHSTEYDGKESTTVLIDPVRKEIESAKMEPEGQPRDYSIQKYDSSENNDADNSTRDFIASEQQYMAQNRQNSSSPSNDSVGAPQRMMLEAPITDNMEDIQSLS